MPKAQNLKFLYTIGMVQFPRVPNIERFVDQFMERMRHDYPLDDHIPSQIYNTHVSPEGIKIERKDTVLWQFTTVNRDWGFVLTDQSLCLHTNQYDNFLSFSDRFTKGLLSLIQITAIDISWISSIGFRFVSIVTKTDKSFLQHVLTPCLLPAQLQIDALETIDGIYVSRYKTNYGELRLQVLHNPMLTFPPELNSLLIKKNKWVIEKPASEFVLIDVDHIQRLLTPIKFQIEYFKENLSNLNKVSQKILDPSIIFEKNR